MATSATDPAINTNHMLQDYYSSLESRIGYRFILGGARHFGYYETDKSWPFPISEALRAMENHLYETLRVKTGDQVLDAGCGDGHVAIKMAKKGLRVQAIDVIDRLIKRARRNVKAQDLEDAVTVRKMDYHHLDDFDNETFEGAYTMETFVHVTDPETALKEFYRVLKPGGTLALYEYDHNNLSGAPDDLRTSMQQINKYAAMPAHEGFQKGALEHLLEDVGFEDVAVNDLTTNVTPMARLFFVLAYIPFLFAPFEGGEELQLKYSLTAKIEEVFAAVVQNRPHVPANSILWPEFDRRIITTPERKAALEDARLSYFKQVSLDRRIVYVKLRDVDMEPFEFIANPMSTVEEMAQAFGKAHQLDNTKLLIRWDDDDYKRDVLKSCLRMFEIGDVEKGTSFTVVGDS